jgi:hypothetical protein
LQAIGRNHNLLFRFVDCQSSILYKSVRRQEAAELGRKPIFGGDRF